MPGGKPYEQPRRHQGVEDGAMRDKAGGQPVSQRERCDQRAELVTHLARQQPPGELESVKDLGALPPAEMVPQHADIDVRVGKPAWAALLVVSHGCLSFFPMGKQVEQPLQLGGAGLQVRGELRPGLCPAAAQRVKQLAVVVCGPAEFTAGALGQRQGEGRTCLTLPRNLLNL